MASHPPPAASSASCPCTVIKRSSSAPPRPTSATLPPSQPTESSSPPTPTTAPPPNATHASLQSLQALVTRLALTDCQPIDDDLRAGPTLLRPLVWPGQPITPGPGIPTAATLEQLICAALAHHEPRRTSCVSTFLATAGEGDGWTRPAEIGKSHAWAWMAHRRPIDECERFFEAPWEDPTLTAWLQAAMGPRAADVIDDLMT
jgi:hypothetical protein